MQPDLLERARSAVTLEEECAVIDGLLSKALVGELDVPHLGTCAILALSGTVGRVLEYGLPRPVLLGVVAALVPEGWRWVKTSTGTGPNESRRIGVYMPARHENELHSGVLWADGPDDALALLIAILEAGNG